jgi:hypothetical protein
MIFLALPSLLTTLFLTKYCYDLSYFIVSFCEVLYHREDFKKFDTELNDWLLGTSHVVPRAYNTTSHLGVPNSVFQDYWQLIQYNTNWMTQKQAEDRKRQLQILHPPNDGVSTSCIIIELVPIVPLNIKTIHSRKFSITWNTSQQSFVI